MKSKVELLEQNQLKISEDMNKKFQNLENNNKSIKLELEELKNNVKSNDIISGQIVFGNIESYRNKSLQINFKEPMKNTNYSIVVSNSNEVSYWAQTVFTTNNKTVNGVKIIAENTGNGTSGNIIANYIIVPYNNCN